MINRIPVAKRPRCQIEKPRVAGSIPGGDIYFHFKLFACCSLQLGVALANEIKEDHSPVVFIVLGPRYD